MSDNSDSGCCVGIPTGLENETEIRCLSPIGTESEMPPSSDYKKIFEEIYLLLKKFNLNSADHKRTS